MLNAHLHTRSTPMMHQPGMLFLCFVHFCHTPGGLLPCVSLRGTTTLISCQWLRALQRPILSPQSLEAQGMWLCDVNPSNIGSDFLGRLRIVDADIFTDEEWNDPMGAHYMPTYQLIEQSNDLPAMQRSMMFLREETERVLAQFSGTDVPLFAFLDAGCEFPFLPSTPRIRGEAGPRARDYLTRDVDSVDVGESSEAAEQSTMVRTAVDLAAAVDTTELDAIRSVAHTPSGATSRRHIHVGPLQQVTRLRPADLLHGGDGMPAQPLLIQSSTLNGTLTAEGISSFMAWKRRFGNEFISFSTVWPADDDMLKDDEMSSCAATGDGCPDALRMVRIGSWVDQVLSGAVVDRPAEFGGERFFIDRPRLFESVGGACASLMPEGWTSTYADPEWAQVVLWASGTAAQGSHSGLHADIVPGAVLYHIEGQKRAHLFPPDQADRLYMKRPRRANWDAYSELSALTHASEEQPWTPVVPWHDSEEVLHRFPKYAQAQKLVVDLQPGEGLFLPCGWMHYLEYLTPAMSVACIAYPNWLPWHLDRNPDWAPDSCSAFDVAPAV